MKEKIYSMLLSSDLEIRLIGLSYLNLKRINKHEIIVKCRWTNTYIVTNSFTDVPIGGFYYPVNSILKLLKQP